MKISLNGNWVFSSARLEPLPVTIPGSVLSGLLENGIIEDPYYRDNEEKAKAYLEEDYVFVKRFSLDSALRKNHNFLCFDGIDTIAEIYLNGAKIGESFDMHLPQRIELDNALLKNENELCLKFKSPYRYIEEYPDPRHVFETFAVTEKRSPVIRKANYMLGWDWGPNLGDMGLFREVFLESTKVGYLREFRHKILIGDTNSSVSIDCSFECFSKGVVRVSLSGHGFDETKEIPLSERVAASFEIKNPKLWYPNGFGEQPLYDLKIELVGEEETITYSKRIGIREVEVDDKEDEYGRNYCVKVNGIPVFIKGSNYIPEDSILNRCNEQRTRRLLTLAKDFNHNAIRVWGGGYYPDDWFYDLCDELGLLVFQDLMFACASYDIEDEKFRALVEEETKANLRRIRHHASLIVISGNNEIEDGVRGHGYLPAKCYIKMFHEILQNIVKEETDHPYFPSSPTSGDPWFSSPNDTSYLDTHSWWVWGCDYPFEFYQTIEPRFLSEFGCQSFSTWDTILSFAEKDDLALNSPVMISHQKDPAKNNDKILNYVKSLYRVPSSFKDVAYLSMLMQAEGIKIAVEHLRENRYRCNGALYWQLNDCWPTHSCASIDYRFGLKALHYYSKRFYAPDLITIRKKGESLIINVSNDDPETKTYKVLLKRETFDGTILFKQSVDVVVEGCSSKDVVILNDGYASRKDTFLKATLLDDNQVLSESFYQLEKDKDITYPKAEIQPKQIDEKTLEVCSPVYTKGVYLDFHDNEIVPSDNYFILSPNEPRVIKLNKKADLKKLEVRCINNLY